jgi:hypothetical protein
VLSRTRLSKLASAAPILGAAMLLVMMLVFSSPVFGAAAPQGATADQYHGPDCAGEGLNCGASIEHRANPSGKGNFGQCHKMDAVEAQYSSEFNPSSQNTGEADCRTVSGRSGPGPSGSVSISVGSFAKCEPPSEPVAESQIIFRPSLDADVGSECR